MPQRPAREASELRTLLARDLDLTAEEVRILNWATLH